MKKLLVTFIIVLANQLLIAQDGISKIELDSLYREDQFYIGVTYNLLGNLPSEVSQNGFSSGFHLGFIRDMPISIKKKSGFGFRNWIFMEFF